MQVIFIKPNFFHKQLRNNGDQIIKRRRFLDLSLYFLLKKHEIANTFCITLFIVEIPKQKFVKIDEVCIVKFR